MPDTVRYTREQNFEWGSILWFTEPDNLDVERLSVGLAAFEPGARHVMRSLSREEQILYVVSGSGTHCMNDRTEPLTRGRVLHIPPYTEQVIASDEASALRLLLVYSPIRFHQLMPRPEAFVGADEAPDRGFDIRSFFDPESAASIGGIMDSLSEALGLSIALLDLHGKSVIKTANHPVLCSTLAEQTDGRYCQGHLNATLEEFKSLPLDKLHKPQVYYCCHNIASTIIPVVYHGRIQAYLKCGEIFLTTEDKDGLRRKLPDIARECGADPAFLDLHVDEIPVEPKSRLYTAAEATFAIANTIMAMAAQASRQQELHESRLSLAREQLATAELEKALHEADLKLLQSQVTPHFLFNTLSTIAQKAYLEGASEAARLTWSLTDLLRATLRKPEERIPLAEEINLLRNYLTIQETRFGDRLTFTVSVQPEAETLLVPCMLFQPLVENAIIHGFDSMARQGRIDVAVSREGLWLKAVVKDDGIGFDVDRMVSDPKKIGLRSTWSRLEHYFGNNYSFAIKSSPGNGCRIELAFLTSEAPHG